MSGGDLDGCGIVRMVAKLNGTVLALPSSYEFRKLLYYHISLAKVFTLELFEIFVGERGGRIAGILVRFVDNVAT